MRQKSDSYKKVALDRGYLKAGLFGWAKWGFLLLFLLLSLSWLAPASGWGRVLPNSACGAASPALP